MGLGLSTGEWWLRRRTMSRAAVSRHLSQFVWHAFEGIAREHGVRIDTEGRLRLVAGEGVLMARHEPQEQYDGPARIGGTEVDVRLRGHFEPIDGHFHWWGRVAADDALAEQTSGAEVTLVTPYGEATGRLTDVDPWGRFRVSGTGKPALLSGDLRHRRRRDMHRFPM